MLKIVAIFESMALYFGCTGKYMYKTKKNQQFKYPKAHVGDQIDQYFSTEVADPYRWLEDDCSQQTGNWVKEQNQFTKSVLGQLSGREVIKSQLKKHQDFERLEVPFIKGKYIWFFKNSGLQNQSVLYRQSLDQTEEAEVFLDPNLFNSNGTASLAGYQFSVTGKYLAYQVSENGSDWNRIYVVEVASGERINSTGIESKFSDLAWVGDKGFYYSRYDRGCNDSFSVKNDQHKLYYHLLGGREDTLVFGNTDEQESRYVSAEVSEDGRYLFAYSCKTTSGNRLFIKDLSQPDHGWVAAVTDEGSSVWYLVSDQGWIYFYTNLDAVNGKVVRCRADKSQPEYWETVIAETDHAMDCNISGKYFFAHYVVDVCSRVKQYDFSGNYIQDIALPGLGSVEGFAAEKNQKKTFFGFSNYTTAKEIYCLDLDTQEIELFKSSSSPFKGTDYLSEQVFYPSKDGTCIPMTIVRHKKTQLTKKNPTILYGYGGFQASLLPEFDPNIAAWLELGGIYAVANLRGGSEYGKAWHDAGCRLNKQNVFDDFIAAAEFLIDKQYTNSDFLAINGASNGGLLVAAVMLQRPELFKVVVPEVGVLDMLRYHTFTAGAGWSYDYGTAEDSQEMFEYLKAYSPVHNVISDVNYPATLILTSDHDDRVVPAHSFKFSAALQAHSNGTNPQLIRIETDAGHGAGTPTSKRLEAKADVYGFILQQMDFSLL